MTNYVNYIRNFPFDRIIADNIKNGDSPKAAKREAWMEYWKTRENASGSIGGFKYEASCSGCKTHKEFGSTDGVRAFTYNHAKCGKDTVTFRGMKVKWNGRSWG